MIILCAIGNTHLMTWGRRNIVWQNYEYNWYDFVLCKVSVIWIFMRSAQIDRWFLILTFFKKIRYAIENNTPKLQSLVVNVRGTQRKLAQWHFIKMVLYIYSVCACEVFLGFPLLHAWLCLAPLDHHLSVGWALGIWRHGLAIMFGTLVSLH